MPKSRTPPSESRKSTSISPGRRYSAEYAQAALPTAATVAGVVAALYFGREVFLPLAIAVLLTFALAPLVSILRRFGLPKLLAVGASVFVAFAIIGLFAFILAAQIADMARNATVYQANILSKIQVLKTTTSSPGLLERVGSAIERVGKEIEKETAPSASDNATPREPPPLKVEVISRQRPLEVLQNLVGPLVGPLSTTGLVIVVVIFMLLEREDLRDRFIRLVGYGDLHRTTEALEDAGRRVGQYLLMQLVVNSLYALPVGVGLWLLGLPNALLWALLTLVLRFVPYIGPAIGMILPMFLAVAVDPGWSLLAWTAALFITMELISNNFIEPWLYGSHTGLSPLAVIVAAIFWTWLWGPLGLVLSTPLTVCLVVLGKNVPQFEFLQVLFGDNQILDPRARLYQRLLAGDPEEATDQAEEHLSRTNLMEYYGEVALPALLLAERDRARGVLRSDQLQRVVDSAYVLLANLEEAVSAEAPDESDVTHRTTTDPSTVSELGSSDTEAETETTASEPRYSHPSLAAQGGLAQDALALDMSMATRTLESVGTKPRHARSTSPNDPAAAAEVDLRPPQADWRDSAQTTRRVLCVGGRGALDDVAAGMLAQVLESLDAQVDIISFTDLDFRRMRDLDLSAIDTVIVSYLNPDSLIHARLTTRRFKRLKRELRVGIAFWGRTLEDSSELVERLNADFVATNLSTIVQHAVGSTPAHTAAS